MGFKPGRTNIPDLDVDSGTLSVDETNNRVGIGDTGPDATLDVQGASDSAVPTFRVDHDDTNVVAVLIDAANIDADVVDITADAVTTVNVIDITADALTTGKVLNINCTNNSLNGGNLVYAEYDGTSTNVQELVKLVNDNASATKTIPLDIQQDAAHPAPSIRVNGPILGTMSVAIDDTNSNTTITVAQLIGGVLARGTNNAINATRTSITPTAAQIVAAIPNCAVNQEFKFKFCNIDQTDSIILDLGTGVTDITADATRTYTLTNGQARNFMFRVTNVTGSSEAVTVIPDGPAYTVVS